MTKVIPTRNRCEHVAAISHRVLFSYFSYLNHVAA